VAINEIPGAPNSLFASARNFSRFSLLLLSSSVYDLVLRAASVSSRQFNGT